MSAHALKTLLQILCPPDCPSLERLTLDYTHNSKHPIRQSAVSHLVCRDPSNKYGTGFHKLKDSDMHEAN